MQSNAPASHTARKHKRQRRPSKQHLPLPDEPTEQDALATEHQAPTSQYERRKRRDQAALAQLNDPSLEAAVEGCSHELSPVTVAELDALTDMRERVSGADIARLKQHQATIDEHRRAELQEKMAAKLQAQGITDDSSLEEVAELIGQVLTPWRTLETEKKEGAVRQVAYPAVKPVKRLLVKHTGGGKKQHAKRMSSAEEHFVYDLPIEQQLEEEWRHQPRRYWAMKEFLKQICEKVAEANGREALPSEHVIDDYYTSLGGLHHPHLGKSEQFLGVAAALIAFAELDANAYV